MKVAYVLSIWSKSILANLNRVPRPENGDEEKLYLLVSVRCYQWLD